MYSAEAVAMLTVRLLASGKEWPLACCSYLNFEWACQENVVLCPEGFFFTADRSGANFADEIPSGQPSGQRVQRETVIVSQNLLGLILRNDSFFI